MQDKTPLVVDLDGTLIKTDLLIESLISFFKTNPFQFFRIFLWILKGKAYLKDRLAEVSSVDAKTLPYNKAVIQFIQKMKEQGRPIVLATASHKEYAKCIADYLGLFDAIYATDADVNLSAHHKKNRLKDLYGEKGFDYMGNSNDDLPVWKEARQAYIVNASAGVVNKAKASSNVSQILDDRKNKLKNWVKQLRLHQWAKNLLIFVPLLASPQYFDSYSIFKDILAFFLFGLCASSVYVLNDLLDLKDDRYHARKKNRPFAAGDLSLLSGFLMTPLLLGSSIVGSILFLPWKFFFVLSIYYFLTVFYSMYFKKIMSLDIIVLATLYTLRIIAGAYAVDLALTFWMLAFSMFIFLSLALIKRYAELFHAQTKGEVGKARGRGYFPGDLQMISSLGASSGYVSVLVLALYVEDKAISSFYTQSKFMWFSCPILLLWITRAWILTHRGQMHDDPIVFAVKDKLSLILGLLFLGTFWMAR